MISDRLKHAILTELDLDDFDLKDETVAGEVPGWDSLTSCENHLGGRECVRCSLQDS